MASLCELEFHDLFLSDAPDECFIKHPKFNGKILSIDAQYTDSLQQFHLQLEQEKRSDCMDNDFHYTYDGIHFRIERMIINGVRPVYVCRRFLQDMPKLAQLGFSTPMIRNLLSPKLNSGLVLICGAAGSGKTTSTYSAVIERVENLGGIAWSIENPIEIPMINRWGNGLFYQQEIINDGDFEIIMRQVLRSNPDIIVIGEIRGYDSLKTAITAAMSGHLVFSTLHASDIESALFRCASWIGNDQTLVNSWGILSEAISAVFHVTMLNEGERVPPIFLKTQSLWVDEHGINGSRVVRDALKKGDSQALRSEINNQMRLFNIT